MSPKNPTTCVVGGGNSAHVLIPFLADAGHRVHLLTRRPEDWQDTIDCEITEGRTDNIIRTHSGHLHKKSSDPVDVVPEADIIVLCLPVHQYRPLLDRIAPYIDPHKEVFVGTVRRILIGFSTVNIVFYKYRTHAVVNFCCFYNSLMLYHRFMVRLVSIGWCTPLRKSTNLKTQSHLRLAAFRGSVAPKNTGRRLLIMEARKSTL